MIAYLIIKISKYRMRTLVSWQSKGVSTKSRINNGNWTCPKMEIHKNLSSSQRNLLDNFLLLDNYWKRNGQFVLDNIHVHKSTPATWKNWPLRREQARILYQLILSVTRISKLVLLFWTKSCLVYLDYLRKTVCKSESQKFVIVIFVANVV